MKLKHAGKNNQLFDKFAKSYPDNRGDFSGSVQLQSVLFIIDFHTLL